MSTKMTKLVLAIGAMVMAGGAMAVTNTATADATATLVTPLTITKNTNLVFGTLAVPDATVSSVTLSVDTGGTQAGTANKVGTQTKSAASFTVAGAISLAYTPTITYTTAGTAGVSAAAFVGKCGTGVEASFASGGTLSGCTTDGAGADIIKLGATLTVTSDAAVGAATAGTLSVIVAYN